MKPAGLLLLIPAGLVAIAASEIDSGLVTRKTKTLIREGLPAYQPPAPKADGETTDSTVPTTDGTLCRAGTSIPTMKSPAISRIESAAFINGPAR